MRLRGDFQYLFVVLCLSAAAAAEPIPQNFQDAKSPPQKLGNDVALSIQTGADGNQAASGNLPIDSAFLGGESSGLSPKPEDGTLVAVGLPTTETDFGPPIPLDPTKDPMDFGAYPGYPQPADIPDLYDPKTRQKQNGYMDYYEQIRGECENGEELYCCRWGQREVLSLHQITSGPIKCVICQFYPLPSNPPHKLIHVERHGYDDANSTKYPFAFGLVRYMMRCSETDVL